MTGRAQIEAVDANHGGFGRTVLVDDHDVDPQRSTRAADPARSAA
ncbi:MAG: hypothetical protein ACRDTU_01110 [Micromonosporaceae bacterium]